MGVGSTRKNGAGGAGWAWGIGGSGPDYAVGHIGTYVICGWDVARNGGWGTGGAPCMVGVVKWNV